MQITLDIPDHLASRISADGADVSRHAVELVALEEYRLGHMTTAELRRTLGFETRHQLDSFLKSHEVYIDYSLDDLEKERAALDRLGF